MSNLPDNDLEIRYPERGRKHSHFFFACAIFSPAFGNKIPREGTETLAMIDDIVTASLFGNKIPREGTETEKRLFYQPLLSIWK